MPASGQPHSGWFPFFTEPIWQAIVIILIAVGVAVAGAFLLLNIRHKVTRLLPPHLWITTVVRVLGAILTLIGAYVAIAEILVWHRGWVS